jgi:hypothetical protein
MFWLKMKGEAQTTDVRPSYFRENNIDHHASRFSSVEHSVRLIILSTIVQQPYGFIK